jgi:glycosyltransferase involved in cell wall biosynthesis
MKFSLFLNTRHRVGLLGDLLQSIERVTDRPEEVEILLGIDKDDYATTTFIDHLDMVVSNLDLKDNIFVYSDNRPTNLHVKMNFLASQSTGDYLFVLNDDVQFITPGWDSLILEAIKKKAREPDNVYYIGVNDTSIDKDSEKNYASFPILTREAYDALGYFMSEKFVGLGADVHLWRIFSDLDRCIDIPQVILDHVRHNTLDKVLSPDAVAQQMRENTYANPVDSWAVDISEDKERIKERINEKITGDIQHLWD